MRYTIVPSPSTPTKPSWWLPACLFLVLFQWIQEFPKSPAVGILLCYLLVCTWIMIQSETTQAQKGFWSTSYSTSQRLPDLWAYLMTMWWARALCPGGAGTHVLSCVSCWSPWRLGSTFSPTGYARWIDLKLLSYAPDQARTQVTINVQTCKIGFTLRGMIVANLISESVPPHGRLSLFLPSCAHMYIHATIFIGWTMSSS